MGQTINNDITGGDLLANYRSFNSLIQNPYSFKPSNTIANQANNSELAVLQRYEPGMPLSNTAATNAVNYQTGRDFTLDGKTISGGANPYQFAPKQDAGFDIGGAVGKYGGMALGAADTLVNAYYAGKNFRLQEDAQNYLKGRDARADAKESKFAERVGGDA